MGLPSGPQFEIKSLGSFGASGFPVRSLSHCLKPSTTSGSTSSSLGQPASAWGISVLPLSCLPLLASPSLSPTLKILRRASIKPVAPIFFLQGVLGSFCDAYWGIVAAAASLTLLLRLLLKQFQQLRILLTKTLLTTATATRPLGLARINAPSAISLANWVRCHMHICPIVGNHELHCALAWCP